MTFEMLPLDVNGIACGEPITCSFTVDHLLRYGNVSMKAFEALEESESLDLAVTRKFRKTKETV